MFRARQATVGEILSGPATYKVPVFQRPYAWDDEHASQLYEDLFLSLIEGEPEQEPSPHFMGAIILVIGDNMKPALIVDGQQRLVTLTSLLAIIRDKLVDKDERKHLDECIWCSGQFFNSDNIRSRLSIRETDQLFLRKS